MDTLPTELIVYLAGFLLETDRLRFWNVSKLFRATIKASFALAPSTLFLPCYVTTTDEIKMHLASAPAFRGFTTCTLYYMGDFYRPSAPPSTYDVLRVLSDCVSLTKITFHDGWGARYYRPEDSPILPLVGVTAVNLSKGLNIDNILSDLPSLFPNLRNLDLSDCKYKFTTFVSVLITLSGLRELDFRGILSSWVVQAICTNLAKNNPSLRLILSGSRGPTGRDIWRYWLNSTNFQQQYPNFRIVLVGGFDDDGGDYAAPHITNISPMIFFGIGLNDWLKLNSLQ
jgi:hypothetical protein